MKQSAPKHIYVAIGFLRYFIRERQTTFALPDSTDTYNMEENEHIVISGLQVSAILVAFDEHKKIRGLPEHLKTLAGYMIDVDTSAKEYRVFFSPVGANLPHNGIMILHPYFSAGYVLDKKSLKILKRVR